MNFHSGSLYFLTDLLYTFRSAGVAVFQPSFEGFAHINFAHQVIPRSISRQLINQPGEKGDASLFGISAFQEGKG